MLGSLVKESCSALSLQRFGLVTLIFDVDSCMRLVGCYLERAESVVQNNVR